MLLYMALKILSKLNPKKNSGAFLQTVVGLAS